MLVKKRLFDDSQSDDDEKCINDTCSDPFMNKVVDYQRGDIICPR